MLLLFKFVWRVSSLFVPKRGIVRLFSRTLRGGEEKSLNKNCSNFGKQRSFVGQALAAITPELIHFILSFADLAALGRRPLQSFQMMNAAQNRLVCPSCKRFWREKMDF